MAFDGLSAIDTSGVGELNSGLGLSQVTSPSGLDLSTPSVSNATSILGKIEGAATTGALDLGKTIRAIARIPLQAVASGLTGHSLEQIGQAIQQNVQRQQRRQNLAALAKGLGALQPIAASIVSAPPDTQRQLLDQVLPEVEGAMGPLGSIALKSMIQHDSLANLNREQLFQMASQDPQAAGVLMRTNGDLTKASESEVQTIFTNAAKRQIDQSLGQLRRLYSDVNKVYASQHPDEKKPANAAGLTQSEMIRRISDPAVQDQIPDLRDPNVFRLARTGVNLMPARFSLVPDKRSEQLALERGKQQIAAEYRQPKQPKTAVMLVEPSGRRYLSYNGGRTIITETGERSPAVGSAIVTQQVSGTPEQFGFGPPGKQEIQQLHTAETSARDFVSMAKRTEDLFRSRPEAIGISGDIAALAQDLGAQAEGFANLMGLTFSTGGKAVSAEDYRVAEARKFSEEIDKIVGGLSQTATDRKRIRASVIGLGFAAATAAGQTGHSVSDNDFKNFLKRVGSNPSPDAFAAVLQDTTRDVINHYENYYAVITRGMKNPPKMADLYAVAGIPRSSAPVPRAASGRPLQIKKIP